jgi:hypothetical protein
MASAWRAFYGALGGLGGTLALTGFRKVMAGFGSVGTTAPEQVIERLEELQVLNDLSPPARLVLAALAAPRLRCRDWDGFGPSAPRTWRDRGGGECGIGPGDSGLGSGMVQLADARRGPPAAVGATKPKGALAGPGSHRFRDRSGDSVQYHEARPSLSVAFVRVRNVAQA